MKKEKENSEYNSIFNPKESWRKEVFFSLDYANRGELFEGLGIWRDEQCRALQGTYPVIFLSFARIKENNYEGCKEKICEVLRDLL